MFVKRCLPGRAEAQRIPLGFDSKVKKVNP